MLTHTSTCPFNYANSIKYYEVEEVLTVYGKASHKLFLIKWEGYPADSNSWVPEHSLLRDGCKESIDAFWLKSGINPQVSGEHVIFPLMTATTDRHGLFTA